jgi:hypothetical protein
VSELHFSWTDRANSFCKSFTWISYPLIAGSIESWRQFVEAEAGNDQWTWVHGNLSWQNMNSMSAWLSSTPTLRIAWVDTVSSRADGTLGDDRTIEPWSGFSSPFRARQLCSSVLHRTTMKHESNGNLVFALHNNHWPAWSYRAHIPKEKQMDSHFARRTRNMSLKLSFAASQWTNMLCHNSANLKQMMILCIPSKWTEPRRTIELTVVSRPNRPDQKRIHADKIFGVELMWRGEHPSRPETSPCSVMVPRRRFVAQSGNETWKLSPRTWLMYVSTTWKAVDVDCQSYDVKDPPIMFWERNDHCTQKSWPERREILPDGTNTVNSPAMRHV